MDLENELESIHYMMEDYPNDPNFICDKAIILVKIAEKTQDKTIYHQALNFINQAIQLDEKRSLFLAERAKIYLAIGLITEAKADIDLISTCFKEHDKLGQMYVSQIVRKVCQFKT
jgi:hypothetical protein